MHDAEPVCRGQRAGRALGDLERLLDREIALPAEPLPERLARDIRHDVPGEPVSLPVFDEARVEHRHDVRMLQGGGEADLAEETVDPDGAGELGAEHLDGDRPLVPEIARQPDRGHPAPAQLALDGVASGQGGIQTLEHA